MKLHIEQAQRSRKFRIQSEITERAAVTEGKWRKIPSPSGRQESAFSGRQMGLAQKENLVVFYTRVPRETVRTTWNEVENAKGSGLNQAVNNERRRKR